ncbi:hypothetical protein MOV76_32110 [Rhizobium sp. PRIMUS64]|uniref:hypothetical protein n=1 Tax=Rhizobium sp. PRIMUS64 TaxID=2908925 RepID=UPI001FF4C9B6|nr:hypothetical protein [Rhizobium sp. PRIMUS64]MCJ9696217.1 hypothetical protein [Rhizobium sp. PRIMUS64]
MSMHLPYRAQRLLTDDEMKEQAQRCGCRGADDYCCCQNVADHQTLQKWVGHNVAARLAYAFANAVRRP